MVKRLLYPAVFMLVVMATAPAFGWPFTVCDTQMWGGEYPDGRIYENDGATLVKTGALVQFVIGLGGAPIIDPMSFFDVNINGVIDAGAEKAAVAAWVNAGADPALISGGTNVLVHGPLWTGETALVTPGEVLVLPYDPYVIVTGVAGDKFGWRAWNLSKEELETWCMRPGEELWYGWGREFGWNMGEFPGDGGWQIPAGDWGGFAGTVGWEVAMNVMDPDHAAMYRDQNTLDKLLGVCGEEPIIPEPGMMLLIGSAALLALLRKKK